MLVSCTEFVSDKSPLKEASDANREGASESSKVLSCSSLENFHHSLVEDEGRPSHGSHVCKHCKKRFSSGRALGGHMRAHGSLTFQSEIAAACKRRTDKSPHKENPCISGRKGGLCSLEGTSEHASSNSADHDHRNGDPYTRENHGEASVKGSGASVMSFSDLGAADDAGVDTESDSLRFNKAHQLYTLRRNPKPRKRFEDQEYSMEMVTSAAARKSSKGKIYACRECGRDFVSSKALFGHMRCHSQRKQREIQCSIENAQSFDPEMQKPQSSSSNQWQESHSQSGHHPQELDSGNHKDADGKFKSNLECWMTGRRSKLSHRTISPLPSVPHHNSELDPLPIAGIEVKEERDMANCLVMLSYAGRVEEELPPAKRAISIGLSSD